MDRETRRAILDARAVIQEAEKADCNEAETRRRIERIFETLMGYDPFKHLSRERAVRGAGETEHVDFAISLDEDSDTRPMIMVEIKRVAIDLARKHLKQVTSYAIDAGCEWALLTNGREWELYHVSFGQPPETRKVRSWSLASDELDKVADGFALISLKSLKKNSLDDLWQKANVLLPKSLLEAILSPESLGVLRRNLRKKSGVLLPPEEIVAGIRRLLNESALGELEGIRITLDKPKAKRRKRKTKPASTDESESSNSTTGSLTDDLVPPAETAE